eukprot:7630435-Pyramimonas_sp.AAC.1
MPSSIVRFGLLPLAGVTSGRRELPEPRGKRLIPRDDQIVNFDKQALKGPPAIAFETANRAPTSIFGNRGSLDTWPRSCAKEVGRR